MSDMVKNCSRCGAQMIFLLQEGKDGAKPNPINRFPSENGNIQINWERRTYKILTGDDLAAAKSLGVKLHLSHFADCRHAQDFRRKKVA